MFETAGAPTISELAPALVALLLLPLLAAFAARGRLAPRAAIVGSGGLLALAVALATRLALRPPGHQLAQHVAGLGRVGHLDLTLDLVLDPAGAGLVVLVSALLVAAVLHNVWSGSHERLGWMMLLGAGVVLVATADALPICALGFVLSTLAGWGLARGGVTVTALLASDAATGMGACVLFWALGGSFGPAGYTPDAQPRFAIVATTNTAAAEGKATLSLDAHAGALVVADDGPPLPGEPLRAPLSVTLEPGTYSFRIEEGKSIEDAVVSHVTLAAGRAYVLVPFGPTTSLSNLGDQLRVPKPALSGARLPRAPFGMRALSVAALLLFGGALLRLAHVAEGRAAVLEALPTAVLALRLVPIVGPGSGLALAIALAAALVAVILAARAAADPRGTRAAITTGLAANVALVIACALGGDPGAAFIVLVAASLGAAAALAAVEVSGDPRWLGVACAATTGALPAAGASPGLAASLASELGSTLPAATALAALSLLAVALVSFAAFRVYDANIGVTHDVRVPRFFAAVLAALAVVAGAALGAGTAPFGGSIAPLVRRLAFGGAVAEGAPRLVGGALAVTFAVALAGVGLARRTSPGDWLGAPSRALARAAGALGAAVRFLERSVRTMDREVVDDAAAALAALFLHAGAVIRRAEDAPGAPFDRALAAAVARVGLDDPRAALRLRDVILVVMVALLGLVVLSSFLLGQ